MPNGSWVRAYDERFELQPCAVRIGPIGRGQQEERSADVALTSVRGPSSVATVAVAGHRRVSGTVYSLTPTGKLPAPNVNVAWDFFSDDWYAWTRTDDDGRFALCGLPIDRTLEINATSEAERGGRTIEAGWATIPRGTGDAQIEMILNRVP